MKEAGEAVVEPTIAPPEREGGGEGGVAEAATTAVSDIVGWCLGCDVVWTTRMLMELGYRARAESRQRL